MAEEEYLIQELRKIETRKKEREKKTQDLQKLIKAADNTAELRRAEKRVSKKKLTQKRETEKPVHTHVIRNASPVHHSYLRETGQQTELCHCSSVLSYCVIFRHNFNFEFQLSHFSSRDHVTSGDVTV